jgi:hypothetical protein
LFMLQIRLNLGINIPVCFHFIVLNFLWTKLLPYMICIL